MSLKMLSQKCIWMECGYVEYKLCDRDFDCENCPFDKAIKAEREKHTISDEFKMNKNVNQIKISPNHIWLIRDKNIFTIGLDDFAQKFFDANCSIHFPMVGSNLFIGKTFLWIIGSFGAIGFHSPINGIVNWINEKVKNNPHSFFESDAYLIELLKVESDELDSTENFYDFDDNKKLVYQDNLLVKEFLLKKYSSISTANITLTDGGEVIKDYLRKLSNQDYIKLLKLLFNKKL